MRAIGTFIGEVLVMPPPAGHRDGLPLQPCGRRANRSSVAILLAAEWRRCSRSRRGFRGQPMRLRTSVACHAVRNGWAATTSELKQQFRELLEGGAYASAHVVEGIGGTGLHRTNIGLRTIFHSHKIKGFRTITKDWGLSPRSMASSIFMITAM